MIFQLDIILTEINLITTYQQQTKNKYLKGVKRQGCKMRKTVFLDMNKP